MARVLVVTAVPAERDAVLARLGPADEALLGPYSLRVVRKLAGGHPAGDELAALVGGVGPAAAAAAAAAVVTLARVDLLVVAGIAGGFRGRAGIGDIVVADRMIAADLGADAPDGFLSLADLGLGATDVSADPAAADRLSSALAAAGCPARRGPVLTVSSVTGTEERAALLAARWPALAEAMEGHAVATAAAVHGVPVAELRAVSNVIGRRDRDGWDLPRAFAALAAAGPALTSLALDTADSVATVPAPSEPAPSEPAPSEPAPSEPAPAEPEKQPWP